MRITTVTVAAMVATALLAAPASAQPMPAPADDELAFSYEAVKPGVSTGFGARFDFDEETQSKRIRQLVFKFTPGARLDADGAVLCTAPREDRVNNGHATACPAESEIGDGEATAFTSTPGTQTADAQLSLWNVRASGRDLMNVEQTVNGQRLPPFSGTLGSRSINFDFGQRLVSVNLTVERHAETVGGERVAYLRTPEECPSSRRWKIHVKLIFEDNTTEIIRGQSPCRPRNR